MVEDLVDLSLHKIDQDFGLIPNIDVVTLPPSNYFDN
jgi:hypothetical protein